MLGSGFMDHGGRISFLVDALAARLDVTPGARVSAVHLDGDGARVSWAHADGDHEDRVDACVIAVPGALAVLAYLGGVIAGLVARKNL